MANIKPFHGILYNGKRIDIEKVTTPPYDVISQSMQSRFYNADKYNIVRLTLGKEGASGKSKYNHAAFLLNNWLKKRILIRSKIPSIYVYVQEYFCKGKKRTRIGFIALMKIEDPRESGVLPHEYTLDKPKADRLNLITRTKANLSPIFSLFQDPTNEINKMLKSSIKGRNSIFRVEAEGVAHSLWETHNRGTIDKIVRRMRKKKIFIADGHHRYEVALTHRNMMKRRKGFRPAMNYVMMYFSNLSERENLTILSTHRVLKGIPNFNARRLLAKLKKNFHVNNAGGLEDLQKKLNRKCKREKCLFGMYTKKTGFSLLTLKKKDPRLDVAVLHARIINDVLAVKRRENSIKYVRNERDAFSLAEKGEYEVVFFLRPTDVRDMKAFAEKGEMMPQKSTYFYPKLLTGLVINKF